MKKAKIMLLVIAFMAIFAGVFAAKASECNKTGTIYYVTTLQNGQATMRIVAKFTVIVSGTVYWFTTVQGGYATLSARFQLTL
jgi:hypothetical protein